MTREQFEEALSRYGGDLSAWPEAERRQAQTLLAADADAARLLAQAARLDAALSTLAEPRPVDGAAIGAILAGLAGDRHREVTVRPTRRLAAWSGAALAMFLAIGFVIGLVVPVSTSDDDLAGLVFGTGDITTLDGTGGLL